MNYIVQVVEIICIDVDICEVLCNINCMMQKFCSLDFREERVQ